MVQPPFQEGGMQRSREGEASAFNTPFFGPGMGVKKRKSGHCGNITGENVQKNGTGMGEYDKSLMHS